MKKLILEPTVKTHKSVQTKSEQNPTPIATPFHLHFLKNRHRKGVGGLTSYNLPV